MYLLHFQVIFECKPNNLKWPHLSQLWITGCQVTDRGGQVMNCGSRVTDRGGQVMDCGGQVTDQRSSYGSREVKLLITGGQDGIPEILPRTMMTVPTYQHVGVCKVNLDLDLL